ncbi:MAG: hypothetical protein WKF73_02925 [Nocardioidaceae bacterium]
MLAGASATGATAVVTGSPAVLRSAAATSAAAPRTSSGQAVQAELAAAPPYLPRVRPYRDTRFADAETRHMASRFAYGYTPRLRREMKAAGGPAGLVRAAVTARKHPRRRRRRDGVVVPDSEPVSC